MPARPLERLEGKYEILEKIQEGGMGAIYKVRHRLLGEIRVIKVIRPHLRDEAPLRERFLREARAAARVSHPGIARIFDFTLDDDENAYLVMEYIRGVTLGDLIRSGRRPPIPLALEIARQSLAALGHMHRQSIVHRDVAPDNLMLALDDAGAPRVKLIDLGLAKMVEGATQPGLTSSGIFLGKFRYAAPEQFDETRVSRGASRFACDLYSFGLVLYEVLTGLYPIPGETATSLIAGHLFRPPVPFEESDPEQRVAAPIRRAILRALAKDPAERHDSAEVFAQALGCEHELDLASISASAAGRRVLELARNPPPHDPSYRAGGSTQVRLDDQFAPIPTPLPAQPTEPHLTLAPTRDPQPTAGGDDAGSEDPTVVFATPPTAIPAWAHDPSIDPERSTIIIPPKPGSKGDAGSDSGRPPRQRPADADALVTQAHALAAAEDFDTAATTLQAALDLDPEHTGARELLPAIETCRKVAQTESSDVAAASESARAQARPRREATEVPTSELPTQRLETLGAHTAKAPMAAAEATTAAISAARPADGEPASDPEGWANLDEAVRELEQLIDGGQAQQALGRLQIAVRRYGQHPSLQELRSRLGMALLDRDAEVRQAEDPFGTVPSLSDGLVADIRSGTLGTGAPNGAQTFASPGPSGSAVPPAPPVPEPQSTDPDPPTDPTVLLEAGTFPPPPRTPPAGRPPNQPPAPPPTPASPVGGAEATRSGLAELTLDGRQEDLPLPDLPWPSESELRGSVAARPTAEAEAWGVPSAPAGPRIEDPATPASIGVELREGVRETADWAPTEAPPSLEPRTSKGKALLGIVALLVVLGLVAAGGWYFGVGKESVGTAIDTEDVLPSQLSPGRVLLDAHPWGEIVRLVDGEGESPALSGAPVTPRALSLPPGSYTLVLRHPPSGEQQELQFEVRSGESTEVRVTLEQNDGERFLDAMGW